MIKYLMAGVVAFSIFFYLRGEEEESLYNLDNASDIVKSVKAEFKGKDILITFKLKQDLSCEQLVESFGIDTVTINDKKYFPTCKKVKDSITVLYEPKETI